MSFSSDVKEELCRIVNHDRCCMMAELTGFLITNCNIIKENDEFILRMATENSEAIRRVYNFFRDIYGIIPITETEGNLFQLKILDKYDLEKFFKDTLINIDVNLRIVIDDRGIIMKKDCCMKAFLRGVFIGAGYIINPNNRYHLEIVASNMENTSFINDVMAQIGIISKTIKRKKDYVIYLKNAESISEFLAVVGSNKGILNFEETRVIKEMRNRVNRISNFENANYDKTLDAGLNQIADIELIKKKRKFEKLPDSLKDLARLRLAYREATLEELGKMLEPNLSRAGVSHRFKKIREIANELRK